MIKRGRPAKTERDAFGEVLWFERLLEQETEALRRGGHHSPTKALIRAAILLKISERAAWRLKAEMARQDAHLAASIASFAATWRRVFGDRGKKNYDH